MKTIRITGVPPGMAPEKIRKQSVGILVTVDEEAVQEYLGKPQALQEGFIVMAIDYIEGLQKAKKADAVAFWRQVQSKTFWIPNNICEVVTE